VNRCYRMLMCLRERTDLVKRALTYGG